MQRLYFYILPGILSDIYSDILSGILSDICCRILPGIYSDILSDILCHIYSQLRSGSAHCDLDTWQGKLPNSCSELPSAAVLEVENNEQNKLQVPVFLLFHDFSLVRFDTLTISRAPPRLVKIWGWFLGPSYTFSDGPMDVEHWGII